MVKYSKLESSNSVSRTELNHFYSKVSAYSVANLRYERLFFTGGGLPDEPATNKVIEYSLKTGMEKDATSMIKARCWHSSCVFGEKLYVFGGETQINGEPEASIEVLEIGDSNHWVLL